MAASGTGWIIPQQGLQAFDQLVRQDLTAGMVVAVDWPLFAEGLDGRSPLLEELLPETDAGHEADDVATPAHDLLSQLKEAAAERESLLVAFLQGEVQAVLRLPSAPSPSVGFFDLGMDSLMSVELRNRLNQTLAGEFVVSTTAVFDYPNIAGLARHLAEELGQVGEDEQLVPVRERPVTEPRPQVRLDEDGIAIVGMACRFPGAPDLSAFWRLLETGKSAVTDGRQDSGQWSGITGDPAAEDAAYRRGAFVEGIDQFDARFFRIAPIETRMMDPQRMLLETR